MDKTENYDLPLLTNADDSTKVKTVFESLMGNNEESAMSIIDETLYGISENKIDKTDVLDKSNSVEYIPTSDYHPATKKYVDDSVDSKLPLSGGTLTGSLTLSGAPTSDLHAATKKYVDDATPNIGLANDESPGLVKGEKGVAEIGPWTAQSQAAENRWGSVCYGNGLFVAVSWTGSGNRVMTSPDGIDWTSRTSAKNNSWASVCYGNGLFVAVGSSDTSDGIMTSPDGITWTSRVAPTDSDWSSVCYGNGLFVAVAEGGSGDMVMTSPDGISWTSHSAAANSYWSSVCYGNGLFVAVAYAGVDTAIMTSPDGITWTSRTSPLNKWWYSVCYGNGIFVAVASYGEDNQIITSPDGINWTPNTLPVNNDWSSICYGGGIFVVVAATTYDTDNRIITSPDGVNWSVHTAPLDNSWSSVCYGNGLFVSVAPFGDDERVMIAVAPTLPGKVLVEPDGTMSVFGWDNLNEDISNLGASSKEILAATGTTSGTPTALTLAQPGFSLFDGAVVRVRLHVGTEAGVTLDVNSTGAKAIETPAGLPFTSGAVAGAWLTLTYSSAAGAWVSAPEDPRGVVIAGEFMPTKLAAGTKPTAASSSDITYGGNGVYFSVSGDNAVYTTDGIKWMLASPKPYSEQWPAPVLGDGVIMLVKSSTYSTSVSYSNTNGISWINKTVSSFKEANAPAYGNGAFCCTTRSYSNNNVATSSDGGQTWTVGTLPNWVGYYWFPAVFGNGKFVAIRERNTNNSWVNKGAYSADGITWVESDLPNVWRATQPNFYDGFFVFGREADSVGHLAYSTDGATWALSTLPFSGGIANRGHAGGKVFIQSGTTLQTFCSTDYVNWAETDLPTDINPLLVQFYKGRYFTNTGVKTAVSIDGINWQTGTMPTLTNLRPVMISDNGYFVSTYNSDKAAYSEDGVSWISLTMPSEASWGRFADINGVTVSLDEAGTNKTAYLAKQSVLADTSGNVIRIGEQNVIYP